MIETRVSDHRPLLVELTLRPSPVEARPIAARRQPLVAPPANLDPRTPLTAAQESTRAWGW